MMVTNEEGRGRTTLLEKTLSILQKEGVNSLSNIHKRFRTKLRTK